MDSSIYSVQAREILDSRSNPTVETTVILKSGYRGVASVPSGASLGKYEAMELRDNDEKRYSGLGVLNAVKNVNTIIAKELIGKDARTQGTLDQILIKLDGTPNKAKLGANSILSVSLALAVASAAHVRMPLYRYLHELYPQLQKNPLKKIPTPLFNIINGGKHGAGNLDFQEFHVIPATNKTYEEALQMGVEIYHSLKKILTYRNAIHSVGDEGGYAPDLFTNADALDIITESIRTTSYRIGVDVFLGLDVAASHFKTKAGYQIKDKPQPLNTNEFITYYNDLRQKYKLLLIEDPFDEDDWDGWKRLTQVMGNNLLIVGDDLLATNYKRLQDAIAQKSCSAILLKPNQIGTLSEFMAVADLAKQNDIRCVVSHRSGETNDTSIADLAVAIQADYIKFGAPARGERVAKYNRLLAIHAELLQK